MSIIKLSKKDIVTRDSEDDKIKLKKSDIYYDTTPIGNWESDAKSSLDTLKKYQEKLDRQEYFSWGDLKAYESAMKSYIDNSNRLRNLGKSLGQSFTEEEEKQWNDSVSSMQRGYTEISDYFSKYKTEKDYKDAVAAFKQQETMRAEDVEKGMAEVDAILSGKELTALKEEKAKLEKGKKLSKRDNGVYLRKYGYDKNTVDKRLEELEKEISKVEEPALERKDYLTQSKYLQNYFYVTENYVSLEELKSHLKDEDPIAYTDVDGTNVTWQKLYDKKKDAEEFDALYNEMSAMPDWEEESKYKPTYDTSKGGRTTFNAGDDDYERANHPVISANGMNDIYYAYYTDEKEKQLFNYLAHTKGTDYAIEWLMSREDIYKERVHELGKANAKKFAEEMPVISDVIAVMGSAIVSPFEYLGNAITGNAGDRIYSADFSSTIKSTRMEQIDWEIGNWDAFDFIYNTGMSMADSAVAMTAFGPIGAPIALGLSAAAQGTNDALDRGLTSKEAFWNGLAAGTFEGIFEKFSIGKFNTLKESFASGGKEIAKNIAKSMLVNASEETLTEIANIIYDNIANADFSNYETMVRTYVMQGMSVEQAQAQAKNNLKNQVLESMASGGLMGLGFGGYTSVSAHRNAKAIESKYNNTEINNLISKGLSVPGSQAFALAQNAQAKLNRGKSLTAQELVDLERASEELLDASDISKIRKAAELRLVELGEGESAGMVADIITKQVTGQNLTSGEKTFLQESKYGQRVANEMSPQNIVSDDYASDWAKSIGTDRINKDVYNMNLQSTADGVVDSDSVNEVGDVQSNPNRVAASGVVKGADGKQYFDDGSGDEYFGDVAGDDVAHGGDEYDNVSHLTTAEGGASPQGEAIDSENAKDLQLSEPALKDIARAPTAEESIAAAISNEQLDTKQLRISDFVKKHFPEITLKFSGNMTKDGLWDPESKTLLLNTKQTVSGMYIEVLKHEFMHRLESKRLYQEFKQFLFNKDVTFGVWAKVQCKVYGIELTQNATASEAISKLTEYYHDSVKNDMAIAKKYREAFTMDGAQREMVADFFGEIMFNGKKYRTQTAQALADETFITIFDENEIAEFQASSMAALAEIAEYKPNIFQQIVDWVKRIILKLRGTRIKADAILADELERNIKILEDYVKQVYNSRDTKKAAENGGGVEFAFESNIMLNDADEEAYMSTGQTLHTRNKKTRMLEKGKNPVLKTSEEAKTFISQVIKGQAGGEVRTFGRVGQRLANAIKQKRSSLDLYGKYLEINADDLRESYKRHKNPKEKGDISLSDDDFCKIPEYLNSFDDVLSVNTYNGKIEIHISKETTDGYVKILTIVSKERESLQVTKIVGNSKSKFENKYGTKKERDIGSPRGQTVKTEDSNPSTTARRTADALSNNSISNPDEIVNTEISNDKNNDNSNQNPSFAVTSQMQQLRYNPEAYAKYILRRYGSKADQSEIAALVRQVVTESNKGKKTVDFNAEGEAGYTATHTRLINELSRKIADGIKPPVADYAQDVLDEIHDGAISLDERQKAEIEYEFGSLKEFKRQTGVKISEDGLPLDVKWQQWVDQMPNVFEAETTSPDMPSRLADIVEKMKSSTDEVDIAAISQQIAYEIQHTLDNTGSKATNRRIAEARKEGVAQGKEIERKRSDKIITNQQTIINKYRAELKTIEKETLDKERERREQSDDRASNRRAIERNLRHLDHLLRSNTNARHIPEQLNDVIRKICKLFLDNSSTVFLSEEIKDIRAYYGEYVISEGLKDDMVSNDILTMFELLKSELVGKTLNQVSDEGMEIIRFVTDYFNNLVNEENKAFINGKKEDMAVLGQAAFDAIENKKVLKMLGALKSEDAEKVREFLYEGNITPYYLLKRLGKPFLRIFNDLIAGQNRATQNMDIAAAKFEEVKQKRNYKAWKNDIFEHTTERGVKLTLTVEQLLQIYATSRREQSNKVQRAKHLLGGIVLDQKAIKEAAKSKKSSGEDMQKLRSKAIKLSAKDIAELSALLTDEQRGYADDIVEFMSTWCAALGNEVTMQLYGYRKYTDRYYIPYVSAQEFLEYNVLKGEQKLMKSPSFSKSLQKKANNPLLIQGFSQVAAKHIDTMCGYNGTAVAIDTLNKMLNHNNLNLIKGEEGETTQAESVWAAIDRVYGSGMVNVLKNFIADVNNGVTADRKYNVFNKWFRTFKKTAVMANLSVAIQQSTAIVKTALLMNPKYLFTKLGNKSELWAECCLYAPIASLKQHGQFHGEGGTHNTEWILGNDLDTIGEKIKDLFSKESKTRDDYLGKLAEKGDQVTWRRIWAAVKVELADSGKYDTKSKEYLEACGERFTEIIVRTQVYDSVLSRSQNMRDKGLIGSMTSFMMEPTYAINIVGDAIIEYVEEPNKKNAKQLLRTVIVMSSTELAVAIAKSFITAMRDDDDEDETYLEKYVEAVTANFISGMNPISKVPFLADIYSNIEGYTTERADMQVISDLVTALEGLSSEQKTTQEKIVNVVGAVSNLFGVPAKNVYRDIKGLVNTITSFADFEMPKGSEIVESFKKGAGESFAIVGGIKEFVEYTFNSIEMSGYLSDVKGNATYDSFDDADKQAVEKGVSNYLKNSEKFEKGELRSKSKTFESLYEMCRKYGSTSKKYRKERKKLIDSGIEEKDLELGLEIAKFKYLEQNGINVAEYYAAKTELNLKDGEDKVYDTDGSGGLNKKETKAAIKKMKGFDENEKDILFDILKP